MRTYTPTHVPELFWLGLVRSFGFQAKYQPSASVSVNVCKWRADGLVSKHTPLTGLSLSTGQEPPLNGLSPSTPDPVTDPARVHQQGHDGPGLSKGRDSAPRGDDSPRPPRGVTRPRGRESGGDSAADVGALSHNSNRALIN